MDSAMKQNLYTDLYKICVDRMISPRIDDLMDDLRHIESHPLADRDLWLATIRRISDYADTMAVELMTHYDEDIGA